MSAEQAGDGRDDLDRGPARAGEGAEGGEAAPICSAKGCRAPGVWALRWNNPKLHPPQRRKTWIACAEHLESLSSFLSVRQFLRETEPIRPK